MGRGRAKAKQQKVARELKYNSSPSTDFDALQRELGASGSGGPARGSSAWDDDESSGAEDDEYEDWTGTDR